MAGGLGRSDHVALLRAYDGWQEARRVGRGDGYCWEHFLSPNTLQLMHDMRGQFLDVLKETGFVDPRAGVEAYNSRGRDPHMIAAILCAGLFPSVGQLKPQGRRVGVFTREDGKVDIHPSSVNARMADPRHPWLMYSEKVKTTDIFLRSTSVVSDFALLLFGGDLHPSSKAGGGFDMLGGYLHFAAAPRTGQLVLVRRPPPPLPVSACRCL